MRAFFATLVALLLGQISRCAPAGSLDADVFLQNGKDAQALNAEFQTLKASDACDDGQMACIKDSIAHCANATWQLDACPKTLSCFALPSVREQGTIISCTSNATALSVINASGATGGIASNSTKNSVDLPMDCDGDDESDDTNDNDDDDKDNSSSSVTVSISATASDNSTRSRKSSHSATSTISESVSRPSATSSDKDEDSKVTVTVTVIPTATLPSETFTLDPSAASSFLSSIATVSGVYITTIHGSAPSAASITSIASASSVSSLSNNQVGIASSPSSSLPAIVVGPPLTITLLSGLAQPTTAAAASATAATDAGYGAGY
ncbi:hypothetical protein C8Q74DRAFT_1040174 [Fomes fomentarius]|nr:hypothetical protein C8Q74DRAFT_1040174 [Fomes fomentarius]